MNKVMKEFLNTAIYLLCVLGAVWLVITFVGQRTEVEGASMENTLHNGDNLIVDKLSYRFHDPERFDIVIFKYPDDESQLFIKRIIGLPGDKVEIIDGKVYINDSETPLEDSYVPETPLGSFGPYEVPENCYFMMGDNRNNSKDSRYWTNTFVRFDQIVGKAEIRYFPSIKLLN